MVTRLLRWLAAARGAVRPGVLVTGGVAASAVVVVIAATGGGSPPPPGTANIWVRTASCTNSPVKQAGRVTLAAAPANAIACTIAQATAATASTADVVGLAGQRFPGPVNWGARTYRGEDGAWVDTGAAKGNSTSPGAYESFQFSDAADVDNVDVGGSYPIVGMFASNIAWRNSTLRQSAVIRDCGADEPILIEGGSDSAYQYSNVVLQNIVIEPVKGMPAGQGSCPGSDPLHLELIRIGKAVQNVLIEGSKFPDCDDGAGYVGCGTAQIFLTTTAPGVLVPRNITIRNSKFGSAPNATLKIHPNVTTCAVTLAYNTMKTEMLSVNDVASSCSGSTALVVGNAGPQGGCVNGVTFTKNVEPDAFPCGTDTAAPGGLGQDANQDPQAGSPLINAAETSGYCTTPRGSTGSSPGGLGSVDFYGNARPVGPACDAGPTERQS